MNLVLRLDLAGAERKFALATASVKDLTPALRAFDRYLAAKVRKRFERGGPGWAPPAAVTLERRRGKAHASLLRRLGAEAWRTDERQAKALERTSGDDGKREKQRARFAATLRKKFATVAELRRHLSGEATESLSEKLAPRVARAEAKAQRQLGRLAGSFKSTIRGGTLTRESTVPWAGVHNEGGTGAHGAQIPARPFLYLEDDDVDALVGILQDRMLLAMEAS